MRNVLQISKDAQRDERRKEKNGNEKKEKIIMDEDEKMAALQKTAKKDVKGLESLKKADKKRDSTCALGEKIKSKLKRKIKTIKAKKKS